jgi:hypothetical protein
VNQQEKIKTLFDKSEKYTPEGTIKDFKQWSGGWEPNEMTEADVESYIEYAILSPLSDIIDDVDDFMDYVYGN